MKTKDLIFLGVPAGEPIQYANEFIRRYIAAGHEGARLGEEIFQIVADPAAFFDDPLRAPLARAIYRPAFTPRAELAPWRQWGDDLEADAVRLMVNACALPVAVAEALMPDAHPGYGLPIGGVLATENAVIPYAVGVDIAVHRKGATPAGKGVLGIIPGSMASPGFVVRGKGQPESLNSASHGAGRIMSRTKALQSFTWSGTKRLLAERGVELLSAGLDEVPRVYKDIHSVMAAQSDLVEVLGRFDPKLVKMCPPGDRAED